MSVTIKAHYDGKTIVPDEPVDLKVGEQIEITVQPIPANTLVPTIEERRAALRRIISRGVHGANIPLEELRRENMYEDRL